MPPLSYQAAGVNVELGDRFVDRIKALSKRSGQEKMLRGAGGYAAVYPITPDRAIALTTDGVGTKVLLAHQLGQHFGIGIDLVAMCANDLICVGAHPTLFLDYFATGKLDLDIGTQLIEGILEGCDQAGMLLIGGETAEMPDMYAGTHYDLAGFALGELNPHQDLLTGQAIHPGQKIIGLASSGIHSNGLSLARKLLTSDSDQALLLEPTRIYVRPILELFQFFPGKISGICHITGGGWRNLFRLNPEVGFDITAELSLPSVFEAMLTAGLSVEEGYKTFNMGMGLALLVESHEQDIVTHIEKSGFSAKIIGEVSDHAGVITIPQHQIRLQAERMKGE